MLARSRIRGTALVVCLLASSNQQIAWQTPSDLRHSFIFATRDAGSAAQGRGVGVGWARGLIAWAAAARGTSLMLTS